MKKNLVEVQNKPIGTVDDLVTRLLVVPAGYTINPCGELCTMAVDHYNQRVYLDNINYIDEIEYEVKEAAKSNGDSTEEVEVSDEEVETYLDRHELYVVLGVDKETGSYGVKGIYSSEKLAKECGDELIEAELITSYSISTHVCDRFGDN